MYMPLHIYDLKMMATKYAINTAYCWQYIFCHFVMNSVLYFIFILFIFMYTVMHDYCAWNTSALTLSLIFIRKDLYTSKSGLNVTQPNPYNFPTHPNQPPGDWIVLNVTCHVFYIFCLLHMVDIGVLCMLYFQCFFFICISKNCNENEVVEEENNEDLSILINIFLYTEECMYLLNQKSLV